MKKIIILFDLEYQWETPLRGDFDYLKVMEGIITVLDKYSAKAVFNSCGAAAEQFPDLIKTLHNKGHEIASHGYRHENLAQLGDGLSDVLKKTEDIIQNITGEKIQGIRCPWLFHNDKVYQVFEEHGYSWASNQAIQYPEAWPGLEFDKAKKSKSLSRKVLDYIRNKRIQRNHASFPKAPYKRGNLLEIPLLSSMDGELLNLISPFQDSPDYYIKYAIEGLKKQFGQSEEHFNLNFHPWLIGSGNRINVMEAILAHIAPHSPAYLLPKDL